MKARILGTIAVVVIGSLAAGACQPAATPGLSDADRAALKDRAQVVMKTVNAHDYAAWAATFTDDAEWLPPNAVAVKGRDAIRKSIETGAPMSELVLTQVDVDGRGDLAYVRGDYTLNITPPGAPGPIADKGKYLETWRKQADGSWKNARVMFNSDNPPAGAPPAPPKKK